MTNISDLEKTIQIKFTNKKLLFSALAHPSYLNENEAGFDSYQRLEFLGDAILGLVASLTIYQEFSKIREGRLTEIRAALVKTQTLAKCARKINLGQYLLLSKGEEANRGRENENILADALEALIAAIYLDKNLDAVFAFFKKFIKEELTAIMKKELYIDPKTKFQEYIQAKYKITPVYKILQQKRVGQETLFVVGLYVGEKRVAVGSGKNKKLAELSAVNQAVGKLNSL